MVLLTCWRLPYWHLFFLTASIVISQNVPSAHRIFEDINPAFHYVTQEPQSNTSVLLPLDWVSDCSLAETSLCKRLSKAPAYSYVDRWVWRKAGHCLVGSWVPASAWLASEDGRTVKIAAQCRAQLTRMRKIVLTQEYNRASVNVLEFLKVNTNGKQVDDRLASWIMQGIA